MNNSYGQSLDRVFENDLIEALNLYQEFLEYRETLEWEDKHSDGEYEEWLEQTYTLGNPETVDDIPF